MKAASRPKRAASPFSHITLWSVEIIMSDCPSSLAQLGCFMPAAFAIWLWVLPRASRISLSTISASSSRVRRAAIRRVLAVPVRATSSQNDFATSLASISARSPSPRAV